MELFNTYNICTAYNTALWYDDKSALTDDECALITGDGLQSSDFVRDDITGLIADCFQIEVWS